MSESIPKVKCVLVGDSGVGKTSLLISFATNTFQEEVPSTFDHFEVKLMFHGKPCLMEPWDTPGKDDYDRLRVLQYPGTDLFLVCFSVANPASFTAVSERWLPEIRHHSPRVPWLLVGTQSDRRDGSEQMSAEDAREWAESSGGQGYCEVSALTLEGVTHLFQHAVIEHGLRKPEPKKELCIVL